MSFCNEKEQQNWKEIIETVSLEIKKNRMMVEKDIIQSMFLFELSKSDLPLVLLYARVEHLYLKLII